MTAPIQFVKALVTGASGFLGKCLVGQLLEQGVTVRCLVRSSTSGEALRSTIEPAYQSNLEIVEGNLERLDLTPGLMEACEVVFHLAAEMQGSTAVLFLGNVIAFRKLIQMASAAKLRRFVLIGSIAVHDTSRLAVGSIVDENCPLDPQPHRRDGYTFSKVVQEQVAWEAYRDQQLPLVVIRPGVIFGPGRDCLAGRLGLRFGNFVLVMNGRRELPYTYRDNCARAILHAGLSDGVAAGESFNIVDDHLPTPRDLLAKYRNSVGPIRSLTLPGWAVSSLSGFWEWYYRWSEGQLPAMLSRYKSGSLWKPLQYSNAKAKSVLKWTPEIDFAAGMDRTLDWLRANRKTGSVP